MVLPTAYPSPSLGSSALIGFSHHFKTFKPKLVIYKICVDFSVTEFSFLFIAQLFSSTKAPTYAKYTCLADIVRFEKGKFPGKRSSSQ